MLGPGNLGHYIQDIIQIHINMPPGVCIIPAHFVIFLLFFIT